MTGAWIDGCLLGAHGVRCRVQGVGGTGLELYVHLSAQTVELHTQVCRQVMVSMAMPPPPGRLFWQLLIGCEKHGFSQEMKCAVTVAGRTEPGSCFSSREETRQALR